MIILFSILNLFFSESFRDLPEKPGTEFVRNTESKYPCKLVAFGYDAPNDISGFSFMFDIKLPYSKELSRKLIVELIDDLKTRINNYNKMRPYLDHYPFSEKGIYLDLQFEDGNVSTRKGKIYFTSPDQLEEVETYDEAKEIVSKRLPSPSA